MNSVDAREAILLCQKAYFNIATFRSTIDLLSEFADSQIYVEGGTDKSRKFVKFKPSVFFKNKLNNI